MENKLIVCKECNSSNIEVRGWINPNTDKAIDMIFDCDIEDRWCNDCKEHVHFKLISTDNTNKKQS